MRHEQAVVVEDQRPFPGTSARRAVVSVNSVCPNAGLKSNALGVEGARSSG
jgi:hypothetical protein